jgi:hypothetical protein
MASGLPFVATRVGAQPWVAGDAGILVTPGDSDELATQINALLSDDRLYGQLVQRGLQRALDFSLEAYNNNWMRIVTEIQDWLVARPARPLRLSGPPQVKQGDGFGAELLDLPLQDEINLLHQAAEAVIKPYEVRSKLPIVGPLIVWLRRNLTSHLREPYLDPTLRRQERFNWLVVQTLRQVNRLLEQPTNQTTALDRRVSQLEAQLAATIELLAVQTDQLQRADPATRDRALAALNQKVNELRRILPAEQPIEATSPQDESASTS